MQEIAAGQRKAMKRLHLKPAPTAVLRHRAAIAPRPASSTKLVSDYATAPAKFERGEFRGLVFRLLRDNSKSGCSLFSESLAEKSFRHDNCCSSFGGIAQLVERLVRNESTAN